MNFLKKILKIFGKKDKSPKFERQGRRFKNLFPDYKFGKGTYGVPQVHDWDEGSFLEIGSFYSISSNVQIYLGGEHRIDWVTTFL